MIFFASVPPPAAIHLRNKGLQNARMAEVYAANGLNCALLARAAEHGLGVLKPWGESARYDVGAEYHGQFPCAQVKSTKYQWANPISATPCPIIALNPYTCAQIDFMAAYLIPEDVWYIFPAGVATALEGHIWLSPHNQEHKYQRYMEVWQLLHQWPSAKPLPSPRASAKLISAKTEN